MNLPLLRAYFYESLPHILVFLHLQYQNILKTGFLIPGGNSVPVVRDLYIFFARLYINLGLEGYYAYSLALALMILCRAVAGYGIDVSRPRIVPRTIRQQIALRGLQLSLISYTLLHFASLVNDKTFDWLRKRSCVRHRNCEIDTGVIVALATGLFTLIAVAFVQLWRVAKTNQDRLDRLCGS